jgi:hypothetical protein
MRSEIGLCVRTLFNKEWGKVPINGRLRSQFWWQTRLNELLNDPTIIPLELGPEPVIDYPSRDYEFEEFLTKFYEKRGFRDKN